MSIAFTFGCTSRIFKGSPLCSMRRVHAGLQRRRSTTDHALDNTVRLEFEAPPEPVDFLAASLRKQWKRLAMGGAAALLCSVSNISAPVLTGVLFEFLVVDAPVQSYLKVFSVLAVFYTLEPILSTYYMRTFIAAGETMLAELRREIFDRLLNEDISFFDRNSTTELTNYLAVELDTLRGFVFGNVTRDRGLRSLLEVAGAMAVLFVLSWRLAPILAGVIVITAVSASIYKRSTKPIEQDQFKALGTLVSVADQALRHVRTVRSFGGESLETQKFASIVDRSLNHGLIFGRAKALTEALNRGSIHLSLLVLFWYGGTLVRDGILPYRVLVTAIGYVFSMVFAIQGFMNTLLDYRRAKGAYVRIRSLLHSTHPVAVPRRSIIVSKPEVEETIENGRPKTRTAAVTGDLILNDISFAYPLRPKVTVLNGLNLELRRGTRTALVGESGSGKSTISALLCRFYEPDNGRILLDNIPSHHFDRKDWNSAVALVSQEPILFRGTIEENIRYGRREGATMHDVIEVARSANAHEFIEELPDGYRTMVGDKGQLLSGGERQRIAIARALLKDAPIVLLDEATSSLDLRSEAKVMITQ